MDLSDRFRQWKHRHRIAAARADLDRRVFRPRAHGLPQRVTVSLTSYPPRFADLVLTLRSLLFQSVRPDETILWIAHRDIDMLPPEVADLARFGLQIRACDDLRSFKKIVPALGHNPDGIVVTADDDLYYRETWLQELLDAFAVSQNPVICHRAREIVLTADGLPAPYDRWISNTGRHGPSPLIFPTGCLGVLYHVPHLDPRASDTTLFTELCPEADDVWLYWMHRLAGVAAQKIGPPIRVLEWDVAQTGGLRDGNLGSGGNDRQIGAMIRHFGFPPLTGP